MPHFLFHHQSSHAPITGSSQRDLLHVANARFRFIYSLIHFSLNSLYYSSEIFILKYNPCIDMLGAILGEIGSISH